MNQPDGQQTGAAMIWCPFPDTTAAGDAAETLLKEKLIACANIVPMIESVFEWEGAISRSQEAGALFKTTGAQVIDAVNRLRDIHPYDIPAIIAWQCDHTAPVTLDWLLGAVREQG